MTYPLVRVHPLGLQTNGQSDIQTTTMPIARPLLNLSPVA